MRPAGSRSESFDERSLVVGHPIAGLRSQTKHPARAEVAENPESSAHWPRPRHGWVTDVCPTADGAVDGREYCGGTGW